MDENLEAGRVPGQLEEAHDADDAEELEKIVLAVEPRQQEVEIERYAVAADHPPAGEIRVT